MYKLHEGYEKMENEVSEILKPENKVYDPKVKTYFPRHYLVPHDFNIISKLFIKLCYRRIQSVGIIIIVILAYTSSGSSKKLLKNFT